MRIPRALTLIFASAFLASCVQTMISSSLMVDKDYLTEVAREDLVGKVHAKAEELGGACKLINTERQVHICYLATGNPSMQLSIGYTRNGAYMISVVSTRGHWLPPRARDVHAGRYLTDLQHNLEGWMRSLLPPEAIIETTRYYPGYDTRQSF